MTYMRACLLCGSSYPNLENLMLWPDLLERVFAPDWHVVGLYVAEQENLQLIGVPGVCVACAKGLGIRISTRKKLMKRLSPPSRAFPTVPGEKKPSLSKLQERQRKRRRIRGTR